MSDAVPSRNAPQFTACRQAEGCRSDSGRTSSKLMSETWNHARGLGLTFLVVLVLDYFFCGPSVEPRSVHLVFGESMIQLRIDSTYVVLYLLAVHIILNQRFLLDLRSVILCFRNSLASPQEKSDFNGDICMSGSVQHAGIAVGKAMTRITSSHQMTRNSSSETLSRIATSLKSLSIRSCIKLRSGASLAQVISNKECFVPEDDIAQLNLTDVSNIFTYVTEINKAGFDKQAFRSSVSSESRRIMIAMDLATLASRGTNTELRLVNEPGTGDIDALYFAAAVRIFAEWRILRLAPDGFKRYAMGLNLGRRDLVQNLEKIEDAVHAWIDSEIYESDGSDDAARKRSHSPTVRELLENERESGLHAHLPRVKDKSGASGLLWISRQLDYHRNMMEKSLEVPSRVYKTTRAAIEAAYREVYGNYHGWTVQQIFKQSFQAAPEFHEVLAAMEPPQSEDSTVCSTWSQDTVQSCEVEMAFKPQPSNDAALNQVVTLDRGSMASEDNDCQCVKPSVLRFNCFCPAFQEEYSKPSILTIVDTGDAEDCTTLKGFGEQTKALPTSKNQIKLPEEKNLATVVAAHVATMTNVVQNLSHLITELNMNDPTKV